MPELVGLGQLLGVGPKRMRELAQALGVRTTDEFRAAVAEGRLRSVPGVGPKTEAKLRAGLERAGKPKPRRGLLLNRAWALAGGVAEALGGEVAGDPRRWKDSCEDFAVVVVADEPEAMLEAFEALTQIVSVVERGERRAIGVTVEGVPVELVVSPAESFGTALVRATGSADYVRALEPLPDAADEAGVYAALGVPWCPPELRERPHRDEPPPFLLRLDDVRGDLHVHTTWSDGKASVLEMGEAAIALGYEYVAICDHTTNVRVVPGLDADAVRRQGEEIAEANERLAPFRVLRGIECDILPDGSLDLPDDVLAELDWVQLSLHAGQRQAGPELTRKVTEAMRHPAVRCLSHPTGRLINHRPPNALDIERAIEVALEEGVALEVNGLPAQARPARRARAPRGRGGCADLRQHGRALGAGPREHAARGRNGPARRGAARGRAEHEAARAGARAAEALAPARRRGNDRHEPGTSSAQTRHECGGTVSAGRRVEPPFPTPRGGETVGSGGAALAPWPDVDHSARSYQCVSRSAAATPGSVCSP